MSDCVFCKIVKKEIPSEMLYEDERMVAFKDIQPLAPVHILLVPRKHIVNMNDAQGEDWELLGHILKVSARLAKEHGVADSGYRIVINNNQDAGQVVLHLHVHIIAGKPLRGRMG